MEMALRGLRRAGSGLFAGSIVGVLMATSAMADPAYDSAFDARYRGAQDRGTLDRFTAEAVRAGQYDQALSTLEQVIFEDPNDIDARIGIARLYYHVGAFDLALGHVSEALTLAAGNADFERTILELKAQIEKANRGVRAYVDVTVGGDVTWHDRPDPFGFFPSERGTTFGAQASVDGVVEFDLQTATRDIITLSGGGFFDQRAGDYDFSDGDYNPRFNSYGGYGAVTLSKGLPDIIDTLRFDTSAYGEIARVGRNFDLDFIDEVDLVKTELGIRNRISVRPSVESILYADFNYAWLGASQNMFEDHRIEYGLGAMVRPAPGWTVGAYVGGFNAWGEVPGTVFDPGTIFEFVVDPEAYTLDGWTANADVTHLLHVFADGRSWFHEFGVSYTNEDVLNYTNTFYGFADVVRRESWQVSYDHSVQTSTHGQVKFGVAYTHQTFDLGFGSEERTGFVTGRIRYTHRFE